MHILLVEDNAADIALVRHGLRARDVRLSVATDGDMALDLLEQAKTTAPPVDLVLLDLKLPRKHGLEVLAEIRRDPTLRSIPVVVLTTSQAPRDLRSAYALGARACFGKPSSGLDELLATVLEFFRMAAPLPPEDSVHETDTDVTPPPRRHAAPGRCSASRGCPRSWTPPATRSSG